MTTTAPKLAPAAPKLTKRQRDVRDAAKALSVLGTPAPTPAQIGELLKLTEVQVCAALDELVAAGAIQRGKVATCGTP